MSRIAKEFKFTLFKVDETIEKAKKDILEIDENNIRRKVSTIVLSAILTILYVTLKFTSPKIFLICIGGILLCEILLYLSDRSHRKHCVLTINRLEKVRLNLLRDMALREELEKIKLLDKARD